MKIGMVVQRGWNKFWVVGMFMINHEWKYSGRESGLEPEEAKTGRKRSGFVWRRRTLTGGLVDDRLSNVWNLEDRRGTDIEPLLLSEGINAEGKKRNRR
jgi:hypothetical protein